MATDSFQFLLQSSEVYSPGPWERAGPGTGSDRESGGRDTVGLSGTGFRRSFGFCLTLFSHHLPLCGHDQAGLSEDGTPSAREALGGRGPSAPDINVGPQTAATPPRPAVPRP